MYNKLHISWRRLLNAGAKGAFLTAAIGIAPNFMRPGRAYAADLSAQA
jgi:multiple sugar transport system substrate-binding protein